MLFVVTQAIDVEMHSFSRVFQIYISNVFCQIFSLFFAYGFGINPLYVGNSGTGKLQLAGTKSDVVGRQCCSIPSLF